VLTDAGLTASGAISHATDILVPGTTAMVIGIGGLGHVAVQILRALTPARVIAVDVGEEKLELARRVGAHDAVLSGPGAVDDVQALTGSVGVDAVFDFVANDATMALGAATTRMGGAIVLTGMGGGELRVRTGGTGATVRPEVRVVKSLGGTRLDLADCYTLARRGLITVETTTFTLDDTADVLTALDRGTLLGRGVILPNG
jgi:alcohol dehydrogenase, propanol-preferring